VGIAVEVEGDSQPDRLDHPTELEWRTSTAPSRVVRINRDESLASEPALVCQGHRTGGIYDEAPGLSLTVS